MNDIEQIKNSFGFDPTGVGLRHRGWWIIAEVDDEEERAGAAIGDLCVKARDGALNPIDPNAFKLGNCIGSSEDGFDRTYRYYYYRRIDANEKAPASNQGHEGQ